MSTISKSNAVESRPRVIFNSMEENTDLVTEPKMYIKLFHDFIFILGQMKLDANRSTIKTLRRAFGEISDKWGSPCIVEAKPKIISIPTNLICDHNFITKTDQPPSIISHGREGMASAIVNRLNVGVGHLVIRMDSADYEQLKEDVQLLVNEVESLISESEKYSTEGVTHVFMTKKTNGKGTSTSSDGSTDNAEGVVSEPKLKVMTGTDLDKYLEDDASLFSRFSQKAIELKEFKEVYDPKLILTTNRELTLKLKTKERFDTLTPFDSLFAHLSKNASSKLVNDMSRFKASMGSSCTARDLWNFVLDQTLHVIKVNSFNEQTCLKYVEKRFSEINVKVSSEPCHREKLILTSKFIQELKAIRDLLLEVGFPVDDAEEDTGLKLQTINSKMREMIYLTGEATAWTGIFNTYERPKSNTSLQSVVISLARIVVSGETSDLSLQSLDALEQESFVPTMLEDDRYILGLKALQEVIQLTVPLTQDHVHVVSGLPLINQSDLNSICQKVFKEKENEGNTRVEYSWHQKHIDAASALNLNVNFPSQYCWACGLFNVSERKCESEFCNKRKKNTNINVIETARQQLNDHHAEVSSVRDDQN